MFVYSAMAQLALHQVLRLYFDFLVRAARSLGINERETVTENCRNIYVDFLVPALSAFEGSAYLRNYEKLPSSPWGQVGDVIRKNNK